MLTKKKTALYCRLSIEDAYLGESMSIQTQKLILENYAIDNGYYDYEVYTDDGYTGLLFDRPDFKRMIADIESGKIERVIVKDLSRFGREHLKVGEFIEIFFAKYNVHFIAVNDNIDNITGSNMDMLPFCSLLNEYYVRDISRKQKASARARGTNGKRLSHKPIYGYMVNPENNKDWIIDEKAATVVRIIFQMYREGNGIVRIATFLHQQSVMTPSAYAGKIRKGSESETNPFLWNASTILGILQRQEYCGDTVNFKTERPSFKSKKVIVNPPEKRMIFPDTQPAIIDRELFDEVQQKLAENKRDRTSTEPYVPIFANLVYCADCKKKMYIMHKNGKQVNSDSYVCSTNRKISHECSSHYIRKTEIIQSVTDSINTAISLNLMDGRTFRNNLTRTILSKQTDKVNQSRKRMKEIESRLEEIPDLRKKLFEEKISGDILPETFTDIMKSLDSEKELLNMEYKELTEIVTRQSTAKDGIDLFFRRLGKYTSIEVLTCEVVLDLISRIEVHEGYSVAGSPAKKHDIDIYFVGVGKITV